MSICRSEDSDPAPTPGTWEGEAKPLETEAVSSLPFSWATTFPPGRWDGCSRPSDWRRGAQGGGVSPRGGHESQKRAPVTGAIKNAEVSARQPESVPALLG